jgi:hypothetical protein
MDNLLNKLDTNRLQRVSNGMLTADISMDDAYELVQHREWLETWQDNLKTDLEAGSQSEDVKINLALVERLLKLEDRIQNSKEVPS